MHTYAGKFFALQKISLCITGSAGGGGAQISKWWPWTDRNNMKWRWRWNIFFGEILDKNISKNPKKIFSKFSKKKFSKFSKKDFKKFKKYPFYFNPKIPAACVHTCERSVHGEHRRFIPVSRYLLCSKWFRTLPDRPKYRI